MHPPTGLNPAKDAMDLFTPEIIVMLAGGAHVLGYLIINQVALRLLLLLGTCFYLWYYAVAADAPLWEAIYLSALMGLANLTGLLGLYLRRSRLAIPGAHRDIYARFAGLPPGDFRTLMKRATRRVAFKREKVTTEGKPLQYLTYVISGGVEVDKSGDQFRMPSGIFVGEVAFMEDKTSAASTWVSAGSEILQWDVETLRRQMDRNARFRLALDSVIYKDLAAKVSAAVAPHGAGFRAQDADPSPFDPSPGSSIR